MHKNTFRFFFLIFISLSSVNINCGNSTNQKQDKDKLTSLLSSEKYKDLDICGCNEEGNKILDNTIKISNRFKDFIELKKNNESSNQVKNNAKAWMKLLNSCFSKHGGNMWSDIECNDLDLIEEKKEFLYNFGIQIDLGGSIKL